MMTIAGAFGGFFFKRGHEFWPQNQYSLYLVFGDRRVFLFIFVNLKYHCFKAYAVYGRVSTDGDYLYLDTIDFVFLFKGIYYREKDRWGYLYLYWGGFSCDLECQN